MGEGERFQLGTVGALTLSVVSSVSIVICNKALMSSLHFIFGNFPFGLLQIHALIFLLLICILPFSFLPRPALYQPICSISLNKPCFV